MSFRLVALLRGNKRLGRQRCRLLEYGPSLFPRELRASGRCWRRRGPDLQREIGSPELATVVQSGLL